VKSEVAALIKNPNLVSSLDHVDLTFMFAKLLRRGVLEREDVHKLRELYERTRDERIKDLVDSLRYVGAGRFTPTDSERFITVLDTIRDEIHQIVMKRTTEGEIKITEKELLMAIPDKCCVSYGVCPDVKVVNAEERRYDNTVEKTVVAKPEFGSGENEFTVRVIDDLKSKKRKVEVEAVSLNRVDLEDTYPEEIYCEKYEYEDESCYVAFHGSCEEFEQKTLTGETKTFNKCEVNIEPLREYLVKKKKKPKDFRSMLNWIIQMFKDRDCKVWVKGDKIEAICDKYEDPVEDAWIAVRESAWDSGVVEDYYTDKVMPEDEKEYNEKAKNYPIPMRCELEYAYPHGGGFYYYARCRGSKDYPLDPTGTAESYFDINNTLSSLCSDFGGWWELKQETLKKHGLIKEEIKTGRWTV